MAKSKTTKPAESKPAEKGKAAESKPAAEPADKLTKLVEGIRERYGRIRKASGEALQHAKECGKLLAEAKPLVKATCEKGWQAWCQSDAGPRITPQYANSFITIHENWSKIADRVKSGEVATIPEAQRAVREANSTGRTRPRKPAARQAEPLKLHRIDFERTATENGITPDRLKLLLTALHIPYVIVSEDVVETGPDGLPSTPPVA